MQHILIIDDDEQVRELCRTVLEDAGYGVESAPDGAVALEIFDRQPCELVLCDIFMPNKDGIETILELTKSYFDVKVIAMSGGATGLPDYLPSARQFGAVDILKKPFSPDALLRMVRDALETSSAT
ncbi:MAG TPA: response regulator [Blastocatellia bacterium]|nr:response regulator [Blastocatellia bacterium]